MHIKGILFDLGGTLFSYANARQMGHAIFAAATELGVDAPREEIAAAWGKASKSVAHSYAQRDYFLHKDLFADTLRSFASTFDLKVSDEIAATFHAAQRCAVVDHLPIRPDTLETLRTLKSKGLYLAIVSNIDDDYLVPLVKKHGMNSLLEDWTSSEEARSCKPHSAIYRYALDKSGLGAGETLFVGDSLEHDVAGAEAVGLRSARIIEEGIVTPLTSGLQVTAQPDYEISALIELVGIVESVNGC
jgi:putative hydrolase of the HAD superfamily